MGKVVDFAKKKQELVDSGRVPKEKYGWRPFCPDCGSDLRETGGVTQTNGQVLCPTCHEARKKP